MGQLTYYVLLFLIITKSVITDKDLYEDYSKTKVRC